MLGWVRRTLPPIGIVVIGVVLIALPPATGLGGAAGKFDVLVEGVSPAFEPPRFESARSDLERLDAITAEFFEGVIPSLTLPLFSSTGRIVAEFDASFPAVMEGIRALPGYADRFVPMLDAAIGQRANLARAAEIVAPGIPAAAVPPALFGAGLVAAAAGGAVLLGLRRSGALIAMMLGLVLIVGPLVAALPGKASAASELNRALAPIATAETISAGREALDTAVAMEREFRDVMLPALARRIPFVNEAGLLSILDTGFPEISRGLATFDEQVVSFEELVGVLEGNLDRYSAVGGVELEAVVVWVMLLGAALVAFGIAALVAAGFRPGKPPQQGLSRRSTPGDGPFGPVAPADAERD